MKQKTLDFLKSHDIPYEITEHEAVYTMEDMERLGLYELGTVCKNLFVRDQKGKKHFLVTVHNSTKIDLKLLGELLGAGKLSFASAERLQKFLGVEAGCVSPLGVINDTENKVTVVFEEKLADEARLGVHPNCHSATLWLSYTDLTAAVKAAGNQILTVRI